MSEPRHNLQLLTLFAINARLTPAAITWRTGSGKERVLGSRRQMSPPCLLPRPPSQPPPHHWPQQHQAPRCWRRFLRLAPVGRGCPPVLPSRRDGGHGTWVCKFVLVTQQHFGYDRGYHGEYDMFLACPLALREGVEFRRLDKGLQGVYLIAHKPSSDRAREKKRGHRAPPGREFRGWDSYCFPEVCFSTFSAEPSCPRAARFQSLPKNT